MKAMAILALTTGALFADPQEAEAYMGYDCYRIAMVAHDAVVAKREGVPMPRQLIYVGNYERMILDEYMFLYADAVVGGYETELEPKEYGTEAKLDCMEQAEQARIQNAAEKAWLHE